MNDRLKRTLLVLAALLLLGGCESISRKSTNTKPPCGETGVARVELGHVSIDRSAEFTTKGGALFVTATNVPHGILQFEGPGLTRVYIGLADRPPEWNELSSQLSNVLLTLKVVEDDFAKFELPWTLLADDEQSR